MQGMKIFGQLIIKPLLVLIPLSFLSPALASAGGYLRAVDLELTGDDYIQGAYVNNTLIGGTPWRNDTMFFYSTVDGTLPINIFMPGVTNLLAANNPPESGGPNDITYRLTFHFSDGTETYAWSNPDANSFMFQAPNAGAVPPGWMNIGFSTAGWTNPSPALSYAAAHQWYYVIPDANNAPYGYVPYLSDSGPSVHNNPGGVVDLFRTNFTFPDSNVALEKSSNVTGTAVGGTIAYTITLGDFGASIGDVTVYDTLPAGTTIIPGSIIGGGSYNPVTNMVSWNFNVPNAVTMNDVTTNISSVVSEPGWIDTSPSSAIGVTDNAWDAFFSGQPGWFQVAPPVVANENNYVIAGVLFYNTVVDAGPAAGGSPVGMDPLDFNYSVDGTDNPFLASPPNIMREAGDPTGYWGVGPGTQSLGYYDATSDRNWTWADVNNLRVSYTSIAQFQQELVALDGMEMVVQYYQPSVPPFGFSVTVDNQPCPSTLHNTASVAGSKIITTTSNDAPVDVLCAITGTPTATFTATATATPTATATATATPAPGTSTFTSTDTSTGTPTPTYTVGPSQTATNTNTATATGTATATSTNTPPPTNTMSVTYTPTITCTSTVTLTSSNTFTSSMTSTVSYTSTATATNTPQTVVMQLKLYNSSGEIVKTFNNLVFVQMGFDFSKVQIDPAGGSDLFDPSTGLFNIEVKSGSSVFTIPWDGKNDLGYTVDSGGYLFKAEAQGQNNTITMPVTVLKSGDLTTICVYTTSGELVRQLYQNYLVQGQLGSMKLSANVLTVNDKNKKTVNIGINSLSESGSALMDQIGPLDQTRIFWDGTSSTGGFVQSGEYLIKIDQIYNGSHYSTVQSVTVLVSSFSGFMDASAYPNPYISTPDQKVWFKVSLHDQSDVKIRIYNVVGELVNTLFAPGAGAGSASLGWNVGGAASGLYVGVVEAKSLVSGETQKKPVKITLIK